MSHDSATERAHVARYADALTGHAGTDWYDLAAPRTAGATPHIGDLSPSARELLFRCAFLGAAPIPVSYIPAHERHIPELPARRIADATPEGIVLNRRVATAVRLTVPREPGLRCLANHQDQLGALLSGRLGRGSAGWSLWRAHLPHVLAVVGDAIPEERISTASLLLKSAAACFRAHGRPDAAVLLLERALALNLDSPTPDPVTLGLSHGNLGILLLQTGRPEKAAEALGEAFSLLSRVWDPDEVRLVEPLLAYSEALVRLGRAGEAVKPAAWALRNASAALGPDHPTTGGCLSALAGAVRRTDRKEEALELYGRAVEILETGPGPKAALVLRELGDLLVELGTDLLAEDRTAAGYDRLRQARTHIKRGLELARGFYPSGHRQLALFLFQLGVLY